MRAKWSQGIATTQWQDRPMDPLKRTDVPDGWAYAVRTVGVECKKTSSLRRNQLETNWAGCAVVINRKGEKYSLFVEKGTKDASLQFGYGGGTDCPYFELGLRVGAAGRPERQSDTAPDPRAYRMSCRLMVMPDTFDRITRTMPREVIPFGDDHLRDGVYDFTESFFKVTWGDAKLEERQARGFSEGVEAWFCTETAKVRKIEFSTMDTRCLNFELWHSMLAGLPSRRGSAARNQELEALVRSFCKLKIDSEIDISYGDAVHVTIWVPQNACVEEAWKYALGVPVGLPAYWRSCTKVDTPTATCSVDTVEGHASSESIIMDGQRPKGWVVAHKGVYNAFGKTKLVPLAPKIAFTSRREYEAFVKASKWKDQNYADVENITRHNGRYRTQVILASEVYYGGDEDTFFVLFQLDPRIVREEEKEIDLPQSGDHVKIVWKVNSEGRNLDEDETWEGVIVESPSTKLRLKRSVTR
jgi:hypothetical protein